jgi:transposase InsO family protein
LIAVVDDVARLTLTDRHLECYQLDAFSRRVVGWAMETHLRTELVRAA